MLSFSQRNGLKAASKAIQLNSLDEDLRTRLWNILTKLVWDHWRPLGHSYAGNSRSQLAQDVDSLGSQIWASYFKKPLDRMPGFDATSGETVLGHIRHVVMAGAWNEVFDLLEFIVYRSSDRWKRLLEKGINVALEGESSGYRMTQGQFVAITSSAELGSIDEAIQGKRDAVALHLEQSLTLLTDRRSPDFRNSIKEAISAVEALCKEIVGKPNATLGACINQIKRTHKIHGSLEEALHRLYGFSSDAGGIRHAMTDPSENPDYADALFMLVSCSAFVNYLRSITK